MGVLHVVSSHFQAGKVTSISEEREGGKKWVCIYFWIITEWMQSSAPAMLCIGIWFKCKSGYAGVCVARQRAHVILWPRDGGWKAFVKRRLRHFVLIQVLKWDGTKKKKSGAYWFLKHSLSQSVPWISFSWNSPLRSYTTSHHNPLHFDVCLPPSSSSGNPGYIFFNKRTFCGWNISGAGSSRCGPLS